MSTLLPGASGRSSEMAANNPYVDTDRPLPLWTSHIPDGPLVTVAPERRSRIAAVRARRGTAKETAIEAAPKPKERKQRPERRPIRLPGTAFVAAGAAAVVLLVGVGGFLLNTGDSSPEGPALTAPTAGPAPSNDSLVANWCTETSGANTLTTSAAGTTSTGPGVIAALEFAYYSNRDAEQVASLMVSTPSSVSTIQKKIDALPAGTQHCVTVRPAGQPNVYLVDVAVRTPAKPESTLSQRITVAGSAGKFQISRIEARS